MHQARFIDEPYCHNEKGVSLPVNGLCTKDPFRRSSTHFITYRVYCQIGRKFVCVKDLSGNFA